MNINFELYRIFYVVANNLNITKASHELNISQPAISKSIKQLESMLGGQLFTRTKRGVILTSEGEEFYKYIKIAMEYINNAENKFTELINLETGTIKIGISSTLTKEFLIPYLDKFHKNYPYIKIEIHTELSNILFNKLSNGLIDIVIFNESNKINNKDLNIINCKEIHDCFIINKDYLELQNKNLSIKDLNDYPIILQSIGSNSRTFLDNFCENLNIKLNSSIDLASFSLVTEFTKIGFGIGYSTIEYIKKELNNKELFILNIKENIPSRYISLATSNNHLPNFSTNKLISIIKEDI